MSDIAIRCEDLSKQYRIGKRERYRALRDVLTDALSAPFRHLRSSIGNSSSSQSSIVDPRSSTFWALDDVSFEIKHGEVVGIIGRNGAGKSTLLKILSRITEPTRGFAEINGRVGSLLEVGTGFHPELTGRENIYLNGAILGMKRAEIERRFDEIVAFAETEKFLDTPVKYYSSGMQMRLAFAVAAHLDPEILLVDEVLAVGDATFQKKCLGKMGEVARQGRTVLFVSHNMESINRLCRKGICLDQGKITRTGTQKNVIEHYLNHQMTERKRVVDLSTVRLDIQSDFRITTIEILGGNRQLVFAGGERIEFKIHYQNPRCAEGLRINLVIDNSMGQRVCAIYSDPTRVNLSETEEGLISLVLDTDCFVPGIYNFVVGGFDGGMLCFAVGEYVGSFEIGMYNNVGEPVMNNEINDGLFIAKYSFRTSCGKHAS